MKILALGNFSRKLTGLHTHHEMTLEVRRLHLNVFSMLTYVSRKLPLRELRDFDAVLVSIGHKERSALLVDEKLPILMKRVEQLYDVLSESDRPVYFLEVVRDSDYRVKLNQELSRRFPFIPLNYDSRSFVKHKLKLLLANVHLALSDEVANVESRPGTPTLPQ